MTTADQQKAQPKSDFVAAEEIKGILAGRDKTEQERIVRWVCESLGLDPTAPGTGPGHPAATAVGVAHVSQTPAASTQFKNIKTFVAEKNPKSDVQFAAVVAYYHRFELPEPDRKETITPEHVQEAARLAGRSRFRNPAVPLNNAALLGYLDRAGRGAFRLNAVGENLVAMALPGATPDENGGHPRKKRSRASRGKGGRKKTVATKRNRKSKAG